MLPIGPSSYQAWARPSSSVNLASPSDTKARQNKGSIIKRWFLWSSDSHKNRSLLIRSTRACPKFKMCRNMDNSLCQNSILWIMIISMILLRPRRGRKLIGPLAALGTLQENRLVIINLHGTHGKIIIMNPREIAEEIVVWWNQPFLRDQINQFVLKRNQERK